MRKPIIYLLVALLIFAAAAFVGCEKVWKDVVDSPDISGATDPGGSGSPANDSEDPEEKGELVTLREAYEKGYIDRQDLLSIAYHNQGTNLNEELMGEDFIPDPMDPETLSVETEEEISNAIKEKTKYEDILSIKYLGTYNGYIAVFYIDGGQYIAIAPSVFYGEIDGVKFFYSWPPEMEYFLYKKADESSDTPPAQDANEENTPNDNAATTEGPRFYYLKELYESGEITRQDLLTIAYYANDGISAQNAEQYPEDFVPTPKDPETLDENEIAAIENALSELLSEENGGEIEAEFYAYHGKYGEYLAVSLKDDRSAWLWITDYVVDGVHFTFPSSIVELYLVKI